MSPKSSIAHHLQSLNNKSHVLSELQRIIISGVTVVKRCFSLAALSTLYCNRIYRHTVM